MKYSNTEHIIQNVLSEIGLMMNHSFTIKKFSVISKVPCENTACSSHCILGSEFVILTMRYMT